MADEYILKDYAGGAEATTLASGFTIGSTTMTVADGSSYPTGTTGPFVVVVDRGLATEEKFLIDTTSGTNGVTFNIQQAGYDGTAVSNHSAGATVEHCIDAYTIEQANRYVNLQTTKGDLIAHTGTTTVRHAAGSNDTVLVADSSQSNGIKWSTLTAASLGADSVTTAKINDGAITEAKLGLTELKLRASYTFSSSSLGEYILWDTEDADTSGFITVSSDTITVPSGKTGLYSVAVKGVLTGGDAGNNLQFTYWSVNGNGFVMSQDICFPGGQIFDSANLYLESGDTVKIIFDYENSTGSHSTATFRLWMTRIMD